MPQEATGPKASTILPALGLGEQRTRTHLKDCDDPFLKEGAVGEGSDSHFLGQAVHVVGSLDIVHVLDDGLVRESKAHSDDNDKETIQGDARQNEGRRVFHGCVTDTREAGVA